jgi:hypothetical protein
MMLNFPHFLLQPANLLEDVAEAIVDTLKRPRFDVFVPRAIGPLNTLAAMLPRRLRELIMRLIGADRVLWKVDDTARRGYEMRAARSEPALDETAAKALTEVGG